VFLASGAEQVAQPSELNEGTFVWVSLTDAPELISQGRIINSGSTTHGDFTVTYRHAIYESPTQA
jgi:hypothetical protein